ncbi:hypothetical protein HDU91_002947, partial [Kappamyces sp. JEL0680]
MTTPAETQPISFDKFTLDDDFDSESKQSNFKEEPVLKHNPKRFVLFPIVYNDVWSFYKNIETEDIELSDDKADFADSLDGKARSHITSLLAILYLAQGTNFEICNGLNEKIQLPEARCFIGFQSMQQNVHAELLALMLDHLTEQEVREDTVKLVSELPGMARKTGWIEKYITDSKGHFSTQLASYIAYLSIFNSSINAMIFYLAKDRDEPLLPGLVHAAAKLRQDHDSFVAFYLGLQKHIVNKVPQQFLSTMIGEAVSIEREIVQDLSDLVVGSVTFGSSPLEFEKLKTLVLNRGDAACKALGIPLLFSKPDP